jgi:hypothetical protein
MSKIKFIALFFATCFMTACAPSIRAIQTAIAGTQAAWTPIPSQTARPTQTAYFTYTPQPTIFITKIVTETFTPTLLFTPTKTGTPTITPNYNASKTASALALMKQNKEDGNYLIGVDIAPGIWRNNSIGDYCYWERLTRTGDIIDNYLGAGGGTAYISPSDFAFRSERCGIWTFISNP